MKRQELYRVQKVYDSRLKQELSDTVEHLKDLVEIAKERGVIAALKYDWVVTLMRNLPLEDNLKDQEIAKESRVVEVNTLVVDNIPETRQSPVAVKDDLNNMPTKNEIKARIKFLDDQMESMFNDCIIDKSDCARKRYCSFQGERNLLASYLSSLD